MLPRPERCGPAPCGPEASYIGTHPDHRARRDPTSGSPGLAFGATAAQASVGAGARFGARFAGWPPGGHRSGRGGRRRPAGRGRRRGGRGPGLPDRRRRRRRRCEAARIGGRAARLACGNTVRLACGDPSRLGCRRAAAARLRGARPGSACGDAARCSACRRAARRSGRHAARAPLPARGAALRDRHAARRAQPAPAAALPPALGAAPLPAPGAGAVVGRAPVWSLVRSPAQAPARGRPGPAPVPVRARLGVAGSSWGAAGSPAGRGRRGGFRRRARRSAGEARSAERVPVAPTAPSALAGRDPVALADGRRRQVEVGGVVAAVRRADADRQPRRAGRAREADLAASRGDHRRARGAPRCRCRGAGPRHTGPCRCDTA